MSDSMLGELISDGRTSEVYRFGSNGAAKVLKRSTPQHWAQLEADFTDAVGRLGVPAPKVMQMLEVEGRAAVVFERIDGPSMWQRMVERPGDIPSLTRDLVDVQRAIHAAGVPAGLPSLVDRLRLKIESAIELRDDEKRSAMMLLDELPRGAALLHGDLHPGNVLLSESGLVVIDWFDATVGHPVADIARSRLLLEPSRATDLRHLPGATSSMVARIADEFRRCTTDAADTSQSMDRWMRLRAAGRLAERTDTDTTGLLAMWRDDASAVDDDVSAVDHDGAE